MAYVFKKNGKWYAGFTAASGMPKRQLTTAKNKTQAKDKADELERNAERVRDGVELAPVKPIPFAELARMYLEIEAPTRKSFENIKQRVTDHVLPTLGPMLVPEILPMHIQQLINRLEKSGRRPSGRRNQKAPEKVRGLAPQTRQHVLNHIQAIFAFGIEKAKVAKVNPASEVDDVEIPARETKALELDFVGRVITKVPDRWRGMFAVAVYTGLRKGELLGLRVDRVNLEARSITVSKSHGSKSTKGNKVRVLPIPDELVPYLKVELGRVRSEYMFPGLDGGMQSKHCNLPRTFRNAMKAAGVVVGYDHVCRRQGCKYLSRRADAALQQCPKCSFTLYPKPIPPDMSFKDLRSTCGTHSYEATGDIRYVQELLGHGNVKVTEQSYAKMRAKRMLSLANKMSFGTPYSLPEPTPDATAAVTPGGFLQESPPLTAARSRGLEPLTSGVTGRNHRLGVVGGSLHHVGIASETASGALAVVSTDERSSALVTPYSLPRLRALPSEGRLVRVAEVADRLGLAPNTVYLMLKDGRLPSVRLGALVRVRESDLAAFLNGPAP